MFKCILCLNDFDDSLKTDEHIFPEAIGGTTIIYDLCKECNDHLGKSVDGPFVNNWFIAAKRQILKLPGKKGEIPNPLENGVLSSYPDQKVKFIFKAGVPESIYMIPNVSKEIDEKGNEKISIRLDKKDEFKLPGILDAIRRRAEKKGKKLDLSNLQREEGKEEHPWIKMKQKFDLYDWQRGIIKIAFELTYRKYGINYLSDPIAQRIIELLKEEIITKENLEKAKINGTIGLAEKNQSPFFDDIGDCHYALFAIVDNKLSCTVRIFDLFQGYIVMSENIQGKFPSDAEIIKIDVKNKTTAEIPYLKFIERFS